tara:strand:+ start:3259 stop:4359 length:1101 start_codon:yes stop_codon:yes gene_type:complete
MKIKILIIGGTGTLGNKLINFCYKNKIEISAITGFQNKKKLNQLKKKYKINKTFLLGDNKENLNFINFIKKNKFNIIYFLDYGSNSLNYAKYILKNNKNSILAIANKEMIIAGGEFFIKQIHISKNTIVPLDSEHYSLFRSSLINEEIHKIYITASGGPFYFNKSINLNNVTFNQVISHPKWKMGINNSIDSSNFINKLLEIYELSIIYNIDVKKINFLVSREAYVHSLIIYNDRTTSLNCFENDMIATLVNPLFRFYKLNFKNNSRKYLFENNFKLEVFNDRRFKINKNFNFLKSISHNQRINLILLNNIAHKLYLQNKLNYNDIYDFIISNLLKDSKVVLLDSFMKILNYIDIKNNEYNDKAFN